MAVDVIAVKMDFGISKLIIQMDVNVRVLDNFTSLNVSVMKVFHIDLFELSYCSLIFLKFKLTCIVHIYLPLALKLLIKVKYIYLQLLPLVCI